MFKNMMYRIISLLFIFSFLLIFPNCITAQRAGDIEYTSKSRKAKKAMKRAETFFSQKNYKEALIDINSALDYDSNFVEAYLMAGQINEEIKQNNRSLYFYKKASEVNPDYYPEVYINIGYLSMNIGAYSDALKAWKAYNIHPKKRKRLQARIDASLERAEFGVWSLANPVDYKPLNLGASVNTKNEEYINTVNTEQSKMIFTRKFPKTSKTRQQKNNQEEDFFASIRPSADQQWRTANRLSSIFNTSGNEGAMNISPDQKTMVFTACYRNDGFGRCDIYISHKRGKTWMLPKNIGNPVNTGDWESNPCLSSDGKTLYFVKRMGRGNSDIYTAELMPNGSYGNVKNLGDKVNTDGSEMTPFIHSDGRTLYFASDGHIGMGGMDLFMVRKDLEGKWGPVVNLGYPINNHNDQMGMLVNPNGDLAYISSDMKGGFGGYDIYSFELYDQAKPIQVNYMKGIVADIDTKKSLEANFQLFDLNTNKVIVESKSDVNNGSFLVTIPNDAQLGLNVSKEGYLFYSETFEVESGHSSLEPFLKNVYLKKIIVDQKIVLNNVFFATTSFDLENKSFAELDKVKQLMDNNPKIKIEIGGHTDNIGSDTDNKILSQKRAKAVYQYLVNTLKVDSKKLSYNGYGETQPMATNDTEEGRSLNRRTELKIIEILK